MSKRIGLSPELHQLYPFLPDVTEGGSFDVTIRLTHEDSAFWAMYEGKSSLITVGTEEQALEILRTLLRRYDVVNRKPTRTLLRLLPTGMFAKEPECRSQPGVGSRSNTRAKV